MATQRFGHLDDFTLKNTNVGIGTSSPQDKMEVVGETRSQDLNVTGIATLTSPRGFIEKHTGYVENVNITAGNSGTLSGEIIVGAGLTMTVGTAATSSQGTVDALKVYDMFQPPSGGTNQRPPAKTGAIFYNFDFKTIEFFDGNSWNQVDNTTRRGRGVIASGYIAPARQDTIDFIEISSEGNALDFGDLDNAKTQPGPGATNSRGLFAGGMTPSATNQIEYITIPSTGNGIDFGDLTRSTNAPGGASSSTRMLAAGSNTPSGASNVIDYFEMHTLGNAIDFGDLTRSKYPAGVQSPTRAVFGGGYTPNGENNSLEFSIFASLGNTTSFGDLTQVRGNPSSGGNSTRGLYAGGWGGPASMITSIDFITIASEGNAKRFGDLTEKMSEQMGGCANSVRCTFAGGNDPGQNPLNTISFVTIASTGNAQDFGDLTLARRGPSSLSDSHGGLGGF